MLGHKDMQLLGTAITAKVGVCICVTARQPNNSYRRDIAAILHFPRRILPYVGVTGTAEKGTVILHFRRRFTAK